MSRIISFLGTGNMGGALVRSAKADQIFITNKSINKAEALAAEINGKCVNNNSEAAEMGDYIFLCVKPHIIGSVLEEISPALNKAIDAGQKKVLISIAAGVTLDTLRSHLIGPCCEIPFIRLMPNTPAAIGMGMIGLSCGDDVPETVINDVMDILSGAGRVNRVPEQMMDAFSAVSGCSPAFVYMFIEALADGAVMAGLPRRDAYIWAAQAVSGSASMVLESGKHPGELKDSVCSPGGSTIAGVAALERNGFRSAVIEAVTDAYNKNKELGKE